MPGNPIASQTLRRILVALLGLFVAWRVLSLGMADHLARHDPSGALHWRAAHPIALARAAEQAAKRSPDRATALAQAAIAADPREGRGYRVLGILADARGDRAEALRNHQIASRLSPRDLPTHVWLERRDLQSGRVAAALRHIDLLLRIEPASRDQQFPILRALAVLPEAQAALAGTLIRQPPWREAFIVDLSRQANDSRALTPLIASLRQSEGGLAPGELAAWVDRLDRDKRWGEAYVTWAASLPAERQAGLGNVFNGDFEHEPSNAGFDWRIGHAPGVYIERLPVGTEQDTLALRVSFEDRRIPFNHVRQLLALPPGRYRLEGRARADGLRSTPGMVWSVRCADDNRSIANAEPLRGYAPWHAFSVSFELKPGDCGGQWLQLAVPARIPAEQRIGGSAWFDALRIVRADG